MATLHLNSECDIIPLREQSQNLGAQPRRSPEFRQTAAIGRDGFHGDERDVTVLSHNSRPAGSYGDCGIGCMWLWFLRNVALSRLELKWSQMMVITLCCMKT